MTMETTRLSSKGQVIIPKAVRKSRRWDTGTLLTVESVHDGVLLKPAKPGSATTLAEVVGCLKRKGRPKTLADMNRAVLKEAVRHKP